MLEKEWRLRDGATRIDEVIGEGEKESMNIGGEEWRLCDEIITKYPT
jgi:hypothetical protein